MSVQFDHYGHFASSQTRCGLVLFEIANHAGALSQCRPDEWDTAASTEFRDLYCSAESRWAVSAWRGADRLGFFRFNLDGSALICRGLFVEPDQRRKGVALAMLSAAIGWFGAGAVRGIASGLPAELIAALRELHPHLVVELGTEAAP